MLRVAAFLGVAGVIGGLSVGFSIWNMPLWPPTLMALIVGTMLGYLRKTKDSQLVLAAIYFCLFTAFWLKSFPKPALTYYPGLFWINTIAGLLAIGLFLIPVHLYLARKTEPVPLVHLLFLMAFAVALLSGPAGGAGFMREWLMDQGLGAAAVDTVVFVGRKTVHFMFYGVMTWVGFKVAKRGGSARPAVWALSFAMLHSVFDESRQLTVAERTGSPWDVLLDLAGAFCFALLVSRRSGGAR